MGYVARLSRQVRWYVSSLMGDNHYQRYLMHRRRDHPGEPALSEAQYWRMRYRQTEADPGTRCC